MIKLLRRLYDARNRGDDGIAMIIVMGSIVTLTLLMTTTMTYAITGQKQSRNDQDWQSALSAAQAGVDDYAARLNADPSYWRNPDCQNTALKGPKVGTNTCGWTSTTPAGWVNIETGDPSSAQFHYDVNTTATSTGGGIRLVVTGRSRSETRTLQVRVGKDASTKFVYYTDFESADPANRTSYSPNGATKTQCGSNGTAQAKYIWSGRSGCNEIQFASGDSLDGKVHFNDTPLISNGATFLKGFETADPGCSSGTRANNWSGCSRSGSGYGKPTIPNGEYAEYAGALYLPDNSDELLTATGCHYTGDTRLKFTSDGKVKVWSKGTSSVESGCGTPGTSSGQLGNTNGATVTISGMPSTSQGTLIYAKNGSSTSECTTGKIGDGLPVAGDQNFVGSENQTFYCGQGNVYVEGTVKGRVGIGAQNNIIVTGDLLLDGVTKGTVPTGPNIASLVASNSVVVYHPWIKTTTTTTECHKQGKKTVCSDVTTDSYDEGLAASDRYIYASIQTLSHSFWVQSYDEGTKRGDLVVYGSIAQRWRGIVGTGGDSSGTGYIKDYNYDDRLSNDVPPGIVDFSNGAWAPTVTGELKPAYSCVTAADNTRTCTATS